ncbi:MAG TPA: LysM peptidoglycan-binding domain-containing protein [Limnochordales bacterium]
MQGYRKAAAVAAVVAGLLGLLPGAAGRAQTLKPRVVFGYYPVDYPGDTTAYDSLVRATAVNPVGAFLFQFDELGRVQGASDARLMELARSRGIKVEAVIHNYRGGFDRNIASRLLTDPVVQERAIQEIEALLKRDGYSGVHVDLENVDPAHRLQLTLFMQKLATRLKPQGFTVGMAVPAKTWDDPANGWSGAFDYRALGSIVDSLTLMTYDEHWITSAPGPIASLPWVQSVLQYAVQSIPKEKILLGVAGYGYDWPAAGGMARMLKASEALQLAASKGATIRWDDVAKAPYFEYVEGGQRRIVYFEDAQAARYKLDLVRSLDVGGMALWRLGFEDPQLWPLVAQLLGGTPGGQPPSGGPPPSQPPGTPPPPPPGPPSPGQGLVYRVQPGDTLYLIGQRFGVSWQAIAQANPGIDPWWLAVGQTLVIPAPSGGTPGTPGGSPPPSPRSYVVQPGDTLYLIGQRFGVSWQAIAQANPGIDPWWLTVGQTLVIPAPSGGSGTPGAPGTPGGSPPPSPRSYVVQPGDTLYLIGQRFGVSWQAIAQANPGIDPWWIQAGQVLVVPSS